MEVALSGFFEFLKLHLWAAVVIGFFGILVVGALAAHFVSWGEIASTWRDILALLRRHPWLAAILGFLSIWLAWSGPALLFWHDTSSLAYIYGDRYVLASFNAGSFWLLAKNTGRIPLWIIPATLIFAVVLILWREPDASAFLRAGAIDSVPKAYHSGFIWLEFSFVIFMCGVYPRLPGVYAPLRAVGILVVLILGFLGFVHIADAWFYDFSLVVNISPATLLIANYIIVVLQRKFDIFGKLRRAVRRRDRSEKITTV